ncbi:hypothetical protein DFH06DRAFT_1290799 [Mycena polygramma]|nr:hypothetical protein DFH06DRAFT_1290799 [Mycena polygramma]
MSSISEILHQRDRLYAVDHAQQTAQLPVWQSANSTLIPEIEELSSSHTAYLALTTLWSLALATDDDLLELYGTIITRWRGADVQSAVEAYQAEKRAIRDYIAQVAQDELEKTFILIREALATAELLFVSNLDQFSLEAQHIQDIPPEDLLMVVGLHHRSASSLKTIYIFPHLPKLEILIKSKLVEPATGLLPGRAMDALEVSTAHTILHESRHLVGTPLYGPKYKTPVLVQGAFPATPLLPSATLDGIDEDATVDKSVLGDQGEAGDYWDTTRYGARPDLSIVSPSEDTLSYSSVEVVLTGRIPGNPFTQQVEPGRLAHLANKARAGDYLNVKRFFQPHSVVPVTGYLVYLNEFEKGEETPDDTPRALQSPLRKSSARTISQNHYLSSTIVYAESSEIQNNQGRRGYGTLHRVLMG